jgi:hypothetical protein
MKIGKKVRKADAFKCKAQADARQTGYIPFRLLPYPVAIISHSPIA